MGLVPVANVAGWVPLSLVNPSLSNLLSSSALQGGVVDILTDHRKRWPRMTSEIKAVPSLWEAVSIKEMERRMNKGFTRILSGS